MRNVLTTITEELYAPSRDHRRRSYTRHELFSLLTNEIVKLIEN